MKLPFEGRVTPVTGVRVIGRAAALALAEADAPQEAEIRALDQSQLGLSAYRFHPFDRAHSSMERSVSLPSCSSQSQNLVMRG